MENDTRNTVITIGRQFGSGGRELGRKLADALGFAYYDKELLVEAAREAGMSQEFFERNDERSPSFLGGFIPLNYGLSPHAFYSGSSIVGNDNIYKAQSDFISSLPERGSCVIVGRSADYVLREHPRCVSVFVSAPMKHRVERIVKRDPSLTPEKAKNIAVKTDKLRSNYYNFYTDKTWGAAPTYDLTFDSSKISIDDIVKMIKAYIELRFGK